MTQVLHGRRGNLASEKDGPKKGRVASIQIREERTNEAKKKERRKKESRNGKKGK